jgi:hypothetical protein
MVFTKHRCYSDQLIDMTSGPIFMTPVKKCESPPGQVYLLLIPIVRSNSPIPPEDRILYQGSQLDVSVYSRAELRGSDHKPGKRNLYLFRGLLSDWTSSICSLPRTCANNRRCQTASSFSTVDGKCDLNCPRRKTR